MRLRLFPWLYMFLASILVAAGVSLYVYFKTTTIESAELRLIKEADQVVRRIVRQPDLLISNPETVIFSEDFNSRIYLVQVRDRRGNFVYRSPDLVTKNVVFPAGGDATLSDVEVPGGITLKTYSKNLRVNDRSIGWITIGVPTTQLRSNLATLRNSIAVTLFLALLALGLGIHGMVSAQVTGNQRLFLSFASHELRTPLAVILGQAEVALQQDRSPDQYRAVLQSICDETAWMSKVISNFLFVFRSNAGTEQLNCSQVELSEILMVCSESIKKRFPNKTLTLTLPAVAAIYADPERLQQVVNNLLENAARNTKPEGRIDIKLSQARNGYHLWVEDNGTGIPTRHLRKIFDAFYRVKAKENSGGTGLGLAIARWVVEAHGGKISVVSRSGMGTKFKIYLPKGKLS